MLFADISTDRAIKVFQKGGFYISKNHGAKHCGMTNGQLKITIPRHNRLNPYTLKKIIRDAGITDEEFRDLL